jgi:dTDP-4-dehydrorhamnose reductase
VTPITTAQWPTRAARPARSALDSSKFAQDFNFSMPLWGTSLAETVARLAESMHGA